MTALKNNLQETQCESFTITTGTTKELSDIVSVTWGDSCNAFGNRASTNPYEVFGGITGGRCQLTVVTRDKLAITDISEGDAVTEVAGTFAPKGAGVGNIVLSLTGTSTAIVKSISSSDDGGLQAYTITMECYPSVSSDVSPLAYSV